MTRSRALVFAALTVVFVLAGALAWRLRARETDAPARPAAALPRFTGAVPPARVPAPKPVALDLLNPPCWACPDAATWPIRFRTDLDLLAPLGDGAGNSALWLKDFSRPAGARVAEAEAAMKRRVDGPGDVGKVLPPDDPLLREAEPWADRAAMRFYPDVYGLEGFSTPIPNLLVALTLARSWVGRAALHPETSEALEDCRRAIRWGRLLRQDDAVVIQDLVGLACIRIGAEELYDVARRRGDQPLMLVAAMALGEAAPQRLRTAQELTRLGLVPGDEGRGFVEPTEARVDDLVRLAKSDADRRFRLEAIAQLAVARLKGSHGQKTKAEAALDALAASGRSPAEAAQARWAREVAWREVSPMMK
ncbi:MAG: hypothetical protein ACM369_16170 [Acidobacteriota bacterium]